MARRSSYAHRAAQLQRERERRIAASQRAAAAAAREAERRQKAYERSVAAGERERQRLYVESRVAEAEALNDELEATNGALASLLADALSRDAFVDVESLKERPDIPEFHSGALALPEPEPSLESFMPPEPGGLGKLVPGASKRYAALVAEATARYESELEAYREREKTRAARLEAARADHEVMVANLTARAEARNREIESGWAQFNAGNPGAVVEYFSLVLSESPYPEGFTNRHKMALVPESKQLVVEYELPAIVVVPTCKAYKYVKSRDALDEMARPATQVKAAYSSVVAQTTLRSLHELFQADKTEKLETIVFNGFVNSIDPATGKAISPHLVTVRVAREAFLMLDLENVEPTACLKGLNAGVSKSPTELLPVRPILEFDMVDPRFVQETDVLRELDQRPNLMDLSPNEFESLVTNLFEKMGLETRQTQASRDGGVDCVAYDARPILGGKVVIQAKRYKHTVGVSAVRDLFGTMQNEGASKGILVTTSGYGKASFQFAEGKPLELLSGTHLLYLLAEHAGIEARIEPPEDWIDPVTDIATDEVRVETA
jgi:restriction system protein